MIVTALIAIRQGTWARYAGELRRVRTSPEPRTEADEATRAVMRFLKDAIPIAELVIPVFGRTHVVALHLDESELGELGELDPGGPPGGVRFLGVWKRDGVPLGVELAVHEDGSETWSGAPRFPTQFDLVEAALAEGDHRMAGWRERRLDLG